MTARATKNAREYIDERSIPVPFSGCWLWLLSVGSHGYGQAYIDGSVTTAHRGANLKDRRFVGARSRRKLSPVQVAEIRASSEGAYVLSRMYGIDAAVIRLIRSGRTYRD